MNEFLIIYFNDEKMVKSASEQSRFLKIITGIAKECSLQICSIEDFCILIKHLFDDLQIFVFIHIMGQAHDANNHEYHGKTWAQALKNKYPNCNFHFVTSDISCIGINVYENRPIHSINNILDEILIKKTEMFLPQKVKEIRDFKEKKDERNKPETKEQNPSIVNDHSIHIIANTIEGCDLFNNNSNQKKTKGDNSSIIDGNNNIVQSEIELESELKKYDVNHEDINSLLEILKTERLQPNNDTLISKMKNWWNKVKSYVRDLSVEAFGCLLSSLLQSAQIALIIQAIQ